METLSSYLPMETRDVLSRSQCSSKLNNTLLNSTSKMDAITTYTYSTSAWFGIQAVPLFFFPQLVTALLSPEARRSSGTSYNHFLRKKYRLARSMETSQRNPFF